MGIVRLQRVLLLSMLTGLLGEYAKNNDGLHIVKRSMQPDDRNTSNNNRPATSTHSSPCKNRATQTSNQPAERCYIATSTIASDLSSMAEDLTRVAEDIRFIYKKYTAGFSFCTRNYKMVNEIKKKYVFLDIEEDKLFRIGSLKNDKKYRTQRTSNSAGDSTGVSRVAARKTTSSRRKQQHPIPMHFFRMKNTGNLLLNNYLFDNIVFRMLGINYLIKYFYRYKYTHSGRGVSMASIDVDYEANCNEHVKIMSTLMVGEKNSFSKDARLTIVGDLECDGSIWLSKLLHTFEKINSPDILVLPFSGPRSDALDAALKRMSRGTVIVAAAGNGREHSCNTSPNGPDIIKVGSADKYGYASHFSNVGDCNRIYALGEGILDDSGTSYSAAVVASSIAVFLSKSPGAPLDGVVDFLNGNSLKNTYMQTVLKPPFPDLNENKTHTYRFYSAYYAILVFFVLIILIMLLCYFLVERYRRYRLESRMIEDDDQYAVEGMVSRDL